MEQLEDILDDIWSKLVYPDEDTFRDSYPIVQKASEAASEHPDEIQEMLTDVRSRIEEVVDYQDAHGELPDPPAWIANQVSGTIGEVLNYLRWKELS